MDILVTGHLKFLLPDYIVWGLGLQLLIRAFMAFLSAVYLRQIGKDERLWPLLRNVYSGWHPDYKEIKSDLWYPFILGLIEIYSYPVLMVAHAWTAIGAWIGLKTVAQWQRWTADRLLFQRYLIGVALVVIAAFWMKRFVAIM